MISEESLVVDQRSAHDEPGSDECPEPDLPARAPRLGPAADHPGGDVPVWLRTVRTFHARKGRLSASKRRALEQLLPHYAVAAGETVDAVDLGCGSGETALALASERPDWLILAVDVHAASIATLARKAADSGLDNLRIELVDGLALLRREIPPASLQLLRALFPDPWPKARHRHRRLVQAPFAALAVDRLAPGGALELATDLADYAVQMTKVLGAESLLQGGPGPRFEHPVTFYEQRAVSAHRLVHHLRYVRLSEPAVSPG